MRYMRAADVLPPDLLEQIQAYIDGEYLYIPRRETERKPWGAANGRAPYRLSKKSKDFSDSLQNAVTFAPLFGAKVLASLAGSLAQQGFRGI